jgi:hypothetical protein
MIDKASDCTINQYIKCLFDDKLSVLGDGTDEEQKKAFRNIETEYVDLSGQYETGDYETIKNIISIKGRIKQVELLLFIQEQCIKEFQQPYRPAIKDINRLGYNLTWDDNKEDFLQQLINIKSSEERFNVLLEIENKKLNKDEENKGITRIEFIRMLISLQKLKYNIDRDKTTMEELGIMVNEMREQMIVNDLN